LSLLTINTESQAFFGVTISHFSLLQGPVII
jgi:hypothetical protein